MQASQCLILLYGRHFSCQGSYIAYHLLYFYSCRYNEGEYTKTYPHGQRFRVNSQKKSPEAIGSKMNEPIGPQQKNTPCNRVQESSSLLNEYQITRHSSFKGIESSHSEVTDKFSLGS